MKRFRLLLVGLLVFGLIFALTGCGGGDEAGEAPDAGEAEKLVIKAGTDAAYAPMEYKNEETGELEGFDVDLIKAIGEAVGLEVSVKHVDWDGLFPALESGDINCIISSMTITDERKEIVDFSEPYFEATQIIAVKEGSNIKGLKDLVGKKVGVQQNTTGHYAVEKIEGMKDEDIKKFPFTPDALINLTNGLVDAVVADAPVVLNYIKHNPDAGIVTVTDDFEKEYYGIAVKKGNKELLDKINEGLAKVKEDGTYDELYKKYFE
ncbi:MAG: basic amino acid ABC transporter substrate-binding protein [Clostridia bacterium]|nr:basic amino acid ABC transporter substrate-binding protein [Clostridia bacterium]